MIFVPVKDDNVCNFTIYFNINSLPDELVDAICELSKEYDLKIKDTSCINLEVKDINLNKASALISSNRDYLLYWVRHNGKAIAFGNVRGIDGSWHGLMLEKSKDKDYYYDELKKMCHLY